MANGNEKKPIGGFIMMAVLIGACLFTLHTNKSKSTETQTTNEQTTYTDQSTSTQVTTYASEQYIEQTSLELKRNNTQTESNTINHIINSNDELLKLSYRYNSLSDSDKILYKQICQAIRSHDEEYDLVGEYTVDDVSRVGFVVMLTDEYMLAVNHATIGSLYEMNSGYAKKLSISYTCSKEEADAQYKATMDAASEIINCTGGLTPYEAELYIHDTIIENNEYVDNGTDSHTAHGMLINHQSVCDGYAKSFKIICNRIGIPCDIVVGVARSLTETEENGHAWNIVNLDNEYYLVDTTYDDCDPREPDYSFFNITQEDCNVLHKAATDFVFPEATGTKYNYYKMEDCIVDSYDAFCNAFDTHLKYAIDGKTPCIHLKAKEPYTTQEILHGEKEWEHINSILNRLSLTAMSASVNADNTVTIYLTNNIETPQD